MADTETRIVEMRFDNRDFDPKIAKSKKSLEDFKKELNFEETSRGLRDFASNMNRIDFSGLTLNIQRLTDKFTGLGDAGEWVLSRIRSGIEGAMLDLEQFLSGFTTVQIGVGQGKYDALNKAAQALIASGEYTEKQAYQIFQRIMDYTDQTSANFETMVDKLQEFTASGRGLQESERALEGIFNLTAKLGKGVNEASAAMSIFSKAMSRGYLGLEQWNSLTSTAKIAGKELKEQIIEAAVATGDLVKQGNKYYIAQKYRTQQTLKDTKKTAKQKEKAAKKEAETLSKYEVTADNLSYTLNKKWVSKDTLMAVFDKYYFAKLTGATEEELESFAGVAYKSAQRAMTFVDAMNAIKESISSGWMQSFRLIFGDVTEAMELFTNLCERVIDSIYGLQEARNKLLQVWSDHGGRQSLIDSVLGDYGKSVETGAYGLLDLFDDIGSVIADGFWNMVKLFSNATDEGNWDKEGFKEAWLGLKLADISKQIKDFIGSIKNFFTEEVKVGDGVTTRLQMIKNVVDGIVAILVIAGNTVGGVLYFVDELRKQLQPTIDTVADFFSELGKILYGTAEDTQRTKGIKVFFDNLLESLKPLTSAINSVTSKLSDMLLAFIEWGIKSGFFSSVFETLQNFMIRFNGILTKVGVPILTFLGDLFDIFRELFESGFDPKTVEKFGSKIGAALDKMFSAILGVESLEKAGEQLKKHFSEIVASVIGESPEWLKKLFGTVDSETGEESKSLFESIKETIGSLLNGVVDFIKNFNFAETVSSVLTTVHDVFAKAKELFKDTNLHGVILTVLGAVSLVELFRLLRSVRRISGAFEGGFGGIIDAVKNGVKSRWTETLSMVSTSMVKLGAAIALIAGSVFALGSLDTGSLIAGLLAIAAIIGAVILLNKFIKKEFGNDNIKKTFKTIVTMMAVVGFIQGLAGAVGGIAKALEPFGSMSFLGWVQAMGSVVIILGALLGFAYAIDKLQLKTVGLAGIMGLTIAIAMLVIGISPFAMMSWEGWARSLLGLVAVMTVLVMFAKKVKELDISSVKLAGLAALAAGIAILVIGIVPFALMNWEGFARSLLGLIAVLTILGVFANKIKKLEISTVKLAGLAGLAAGIGILVLAITPFALMNWAGWARSLLGLALVVQVLGLFAKKIKELEISTVKLAGLMGLATGIAILVLAITPFALMNWAGWARSMVGLVLVVQILGLFAKKIKQLEISSVKLAGLMGLAAGVAVLVLALTPFALMNWGGWARSMIGLVLVVQILGLFAKKIKELEISTVKLAGLMGLALGIGVLVLALTPFALMNWGGWARSMIGLVVVITALGLFAKKIKEMDVSSVKLAGLMGLALGIGVLVLALTPFASMNWAGWARSMIGLVLVVQVLGLFAKKMKSLDISTVKLTGLVLLSVGIGMLVYALTPLAAMDWGSWSKSMLGLLGILGMLALFSLAMKHVGGDLIGSIGSLGVIVVATVGIVGLILAMAFALDKVKDLKVEVITAFSTAVAIAVISIAGLITLLGAIPITAALTGIGVMFLAIIAIAGALAIAVPLLLDTVGDSLAEFGAKLQLLASVMNNFSTSMNTVDEGGIDKAETIIGKLKTLIAGLSGTSSLSATVNDFTTALFDLGTGLENFNTHVKDLPDPEGSAAFKMVDKVVGLADTLSGFSIGNFANEIYGLGLGLYAFEYLGSNMGDTEQSKPLQLLTQLAGCATDLQTLSTIGLDSLKGQLAGLGGAMMLYAEGAKEVTGVEGDQTGNVENAMAILQAITKAFTEEGGFTLPEIPTEAELGTFGADLAALAGAIVKFTEASNGLGEGTDKAIELLGFLSQLKTNLVADDVKVANVFGEAGISHDVLEQFGLDIISLGTSLQNFIECTKDIDAGKIKTATDALSFFEQLKAKLTAQDAIVSVISFFADSKITTSQLTQFGKDIEALGSALKQFATSVSWNEQTEGSFQSALDALGFMAELETKLPKVGGVVALITGQQQTLTDLAAQIVLLGEAINSFNSSIVDENGNSKLNGEAMKSALDVLNEIVTLMARLQTEMEPVGGFLSFFTGNKYDTGNLRTDMGNFKGVIAELVDISTMFNGNDEKNPIPTTESMNSAITVLDVIIGFISSLKDKMPASRPLLEAFTGQPYNTTKLASDITNFGTVISELAKTSGILNGTEEGSAKIDKTQFDEAIASIDLVLGFVTKLGEKMPHDNTFLDSIFTGEKYSTTKLVADMTNFRSVIDELNKISKLLRGDNKAHPIPTEDEINTAIGGITPITGFVKKLGEDMPKENWLQAFTGRKYDLTKLKTDITNFGLVCDELKVIADKLSGKGAEAIVIDETAMTNATTSVDAVLTFVTKLGNDMGPVGGFVQNIQSWYGGHTFNLTDLQRELGNFGDCAKELVAISTTLTGENGSKPLVDETQIKNATDVIDQVLAFSNTLGEKAPKVGGIQNFMNGIIHGSDYNFSNLKTDLTLLGEGFGGFTTGIGTDFDPEKAVAAIDVVTGVTEALANLDTMGGGDYETIDRNLGSISKLMDAMNQGYKGWVAGEQQNLPPLITTITEISKAISDAIDLSGGVKLENIQIFERMALGLKYLSQIDPSFDFEPVGRNIVLGIKEGIETTQNDVLVAARSLAIATYNAAMEALHAHSPSRLFMEVGDFITAGMAIGIDDGSSDVQNAIKDMSGDTFKTATNVLAIISQMLSEEINANPTITPVLDLTDLSNGITMMNGMLDGGRMSIDTRNAAILAASNIPHSTTTETNQNGTDLSGVYSRMAELGEKITEMGEQIAKMKVVLDTGAIAGAVTDQVDARIGAKAFYAGRGN